MSIFICTFKMSVVVVFGVDEEPLPLDLLPLVSVVTLIKDFVTLELGMG